MATTGGKDGIINTPTGGGSVSFVETPTGGVATANGPTSGVSGAVAPGGTLTATGGSFNDSNWGIGTDGDLNFANTALRNSSVTGNNEDNKLGFGTNPAGKVKPGVSSRNVDVNMAAGDDSISFANRSRDRVSSYDLGKGSDSITFAKSAKATRTNIDLGVDSDSDAVVIGKLKNVKRVTIDNFNDGDTLKIGGKTLDFAELEAQGGKFGKNITVNLD
jgi:hypothetical protein